ncbi:response regulator [Pararhizobium gei]|uniref:response regulator n=1 Tax=Pararhizobium gei TaxID=1395951 RepID=UPI0023DBED9F|nr:response regulator [Rhizobium gei]
MSEALTEIPVSIRNVLVLEDNFIIAMEAEDILRSLGVQHVEIATNLIQAAELTNAQSFDFALLDVSLGSETSFAFAGDLVERGVRFGFVSGYGEDSVFPAALRDVPRITKPFNEASLIGLLAGAEQARS